MWTVGALGSAAASAVAVLSGRGLGIDEATRRWRGTTPAVRVIAGACAVTGLWWWNIRRWP